MRLFSRGTDIEIEDLRVGRIRVRVRENVLDRLIGWFSPEHLKHRLEARAALNAPPPAPKPLKVGMLHPGINPLRRGGIDYYGLPSEISTREDDENRRNRRR